MTHAGIETNCGAKRWLLTEPDHALAEELAGRLPAAIYDAHAHVYRVPDLDPCSKFIGSGPQIVGREVWAKRLGELLPKSRLVGALCVPFPSKCGSIVAANAFATAQMSKGGACRAAVLVAPTVSRSETELLLDDPNVVAFKPYHCFAEHEPTFDSDLAAFLPEWAWQLAHERGLIILLHMVKSRALADPANQRSIRQHCLKYPNAKLLLAHAGRGFHAPNTVQAITALRGLENVWFDSSAICESEPLLAILQEFGPQRLLWGSDFPVSHQRGRCVTWGNGFAWVTTDLVQGKPGAFHGQPVLVGLESLRALLTATDQASLNEAELCAVFRDNARRLLGLLPTGGEQTQALYEHAKQVIPGGAQLLSKRPEMFAPGQWPAYFSRARGCEMWDLDGRHFYDCSTHGIGACLLGFNDPDVTRAVQRRVQMGSFCTQNPPEEVALADLLCELHPWAERVRFVRAGGEAMSVAVRIARATTDRSVVAVCGYHGWHDWYLAANLGEDDSLRGHLLPGLAPLGVPKELRGTTLTFNSHDRERLQDIIHTHGDRLAAIVMEPCRHHDPEPGYLEFVRDQAHRVGALLIFDEITIGWRLALGGAHLRLSVSPDLAVFAKALGNGYPMAAVIGTEASLAGAHDSFISSTYWTEGIGPAAALATIRKMQQVDVPAHCALIGNLVQAAWRSLGDKHGLPIDVPDHFPALARFSFEHQQSQELKTLYTQEMLARGFLAGTALYVTLAHTEQIITQYVAAIDEVFRTIAEAVNANDIAERLQGPVAHTGFQRLL